MFLGGGIFGFGGQTSEVLDRYGGIPYDGVGRVEGVGIRGEPFDSQVSMHGGGCGCLVLEQGGCFGVYILKG